MAPIGTQLGTNFRYPRPTLSQLCRNCGVRMPYKHLNSFQFRQYWYRIGTVLIPYSGKDGYDAHRFAMG